jgi:uncharacterized glyoxalase superfamily protein PhnB
VSEPHAPNQRIVPYLNYEDVSAALEWLAQAFGFVEILRYTGEDGRVNHAEMELPGTGSIMLGGPGGDYRNPAHSSVTVQVLLYVDDVDAHFARAKAAGARIRKELQDEEYGDRRYDAFDLEGHLWMICQHMRDVPPARWGAVAALGA